MHAASNGRLGVVNFLVSHGAEMEAKDRVGNTALAFAILNNHALVVRCLLRANANPQIKINFGVCKIGAIKVAAGKGYHQIVKEFINHNALSRKHNTGGTPLSLAAAEGHLNVVKTLLTHKVDPDETFGWGDTALITAASKGQLKCVRILLKAGADINLQDNEGLSPLMWAALKGHVKIVEILILAGANLDLRERRNNLSAIMWAVNKKQPKIIQLLMKAKARTTPDEAKEIQEFLFTHSRR